MSLLVRSARRGSPLRLLAVLALATLAGAAAGAQSFGRNKVQYDRFDWHVLQTEHFDVYYYPEAEDLARIGAAEAETAYDELENRFAFSLAKRVPVIFYASNLHFKQTNTTPGFIPDGVGGFFEFLKGRVVIPADGNLGRFRRVIRHELTHVFTFNRIARVLRDHRRPTEQFLPLWFTEGLAEYWSGEPDFQHEMILRDAVASNFYVPLHDLDRIAGTYVMYKEGEAFCRFFAETYGEERILDLIDESWRDPNFGKVIALVAGEEPDVVSDRWAAWIRDQYLPDVAGADVPSLVSEPVVARGFSAKPVVWHRPDGGREVVFMANRGSYSNVYRQPVDADLRPVGDARVVIRAERSEDFEALHLFESRMDVSDDGLLAFVSKRGASDVLHLVDLASGDRVEMIGFEPLVAMFSPTFSPDGRQIAFGAIDRGGKADLYLYDRAGGADGRGALRQLTDDAYDDRDPDLSPDGSRIVFSSDRGPGGRDGAYNLFTLDLVSGAIEHVTAGAQVDLSPRWSPDGRRVAFASARRQPDGKFSAQDLWVADLAPSVPAPTLAATDPAPGGGTEPAPADSAGQDPPRPVLRRLTRFTSAAFDPAWADSSHLVFTAFEDFRFTIRQIDADSLAEAAPALVAGTPRLDAPWTYARYDTQGGTREAPYRTRYQLDVAQGGVTTATAASYTAGGATVAFSDMLGNDRIYVSAYSSNTYVGGRSFLDGLNVSVTRLHLGQRANYGYGVFRLAGPRYDRTDPEAPSRIPSYEQIVGGVGIVSYPLSFFRRIDLETSFGLGRKEGLRRLDGGTQVDTLRTGLLTNAATLVHDNALYSFFGPAEGWRGNLSLAYTTDVLHANENYLTLGADVRTYLKVVPSVTFASWGLVRANVGRRARLNLLGGAWSLRGFPFLRVRGSKLWFTSHELRFPVLPRPPLYPILAGLRGALFVDAAHNWTAGYNDAFTDPDFPDLQIGTTKGSVGTGLRLSLLGAITLRYDVGYRFEDGFRWSEREPFRQFFFGYDF